jgi:hypothetical protein
MLTVRDVELPQCLLNDELSRFLDVELFYDFMTLKEMEFFMRRTGDDADPHQDQKTLYHNLIIGRLQQLNNNRIKVSEESPALWDLLEMKYQAFLKRYYAMQHFAKTAGEFI